METFAQPKVIGYRQLNEAEAAEMNRIKAQGEALRALIDDLSKLATNPEGAFDRPDGTATVDLRWLSIGRTHLQQGIMALVRAIAQPTSF